MVARSDIPRQTEADELDALFRSAMRRLAATVTIITVEEAGSLKGMTATAVSSLSTDPPSILACVNRSASIHEALARSATFSVNILHQSQMSIALAFADKERRSSRFEEGEWALHEQRLPYLPDAQASLICATRRLFDYATHTICIGEVVRVRVRDDIDPLGYVDGRFARLA